VACWQGPVAYSLPWPLALLPALCWWDPTLFWHGLSLVPVVSMYTEAAMAAHRLGGVALDKYVQGTYHAYLGNVFRTLQGHPG
jgi:hypothetical protein